MERAGHDGLGASRGGSGGDEVREVGNVPYGDHGAALGKCSRQLHLVIVDMLTMPALSRHDEGHVPVAEAQQDAADAGVSDHRVRPTNPLDHVGEWEEVSRRRCLARRERMPVLDDQVRRREGVESIDQAAERVVMGPERDEDQRRLPA